MVTAVVFTSPGEVEVREDPPVAPGRDQVLVRTQYSAISAGTELLIYRGLAPSELKADVSIPALSGTLEFPLRYGYAAVGEVVASGSQVPPELAGSRVFAFHPHASQFVAHPDELVLLPADISPEAALFLPNMESALNFLHDGVPTVGERVVVFGQGIVGLLTTAVLSKIPLQELLTVDKFPLRREASVAAGSHNSVEPADVREHVRAWGRKADLAFELSGNPQALQSALDVTGFDGRIVLGSWYGDKPVTLDLGAEFHRSRIKLMSSQVSTISPVLSGRWDKARRIDSALELIRAVKPQEWITHRFAVGRAAEAFSLLAESPEQALQVILTYE